MTCGSWFAAVAASRRWMYSAPGCVWTVTLTVGVAALNSSTIWLKKLPSGPVNGFQTTSSTLLAGGWNAPSPPPLAEGLSPPVEGLSAAPADSAGAEALAAPEAPLSPPPHAPAISATAIRPAPMRRNRRPASRSSTSLSTNCLLLQVAACGRQGAWRAALTLTPGGFQKLDLGPDPGC